MFVQQGDAHVWTEWPADPRAVVVTDPPFGVGKTYAGQLETRRFRDHVERVLQIPAQRHVIRAPQNGLFDVPAPAAVIIEVQGFGASAWPGQRLRRWIPWLIYGPEPVLDAGRSLPDWFQPKPAFGGKTDRVAAGRIDGLGEHPGMTPPEATHAMLVRTTQPGDLIIDPFAGLGGIGTVALVEGRRYWGIEIVAEWARHAEKRCVAAAGAEQMTLWE
jgi:hypothetical protein